MKKPYRSHGKKCAYKRSKCACISSQTFRYPHMGLIWAKVICVLMCKLACASKLVCALKLVSGPKFLLVCALKIMCALLCHFLWGGMTTWNCSHKALIYVSRWICYRCTFYYSIFIVNTWNSNLRNSQKFSYFDKLFYIT